jgi:hypothetical protein
VRAVGGQMVCDHCAELGLVHTTGGGAKRSPPSLCNS